MQLSTLVQLFAFISTVASFPTSPNEVAHIHQTRDCSSEITSFTESRRAKRGLVKRSWYTSLQNNTCITSPEAPKGSNYRTGSAIRYDVTDGQPGVALTLDVGVMDVTTCEPMSNALVEIWSSNAVGQYGTTFLRGAQVTNSAGIAELQTIFPGFTAGSANHIGTAVYPKWNGGATVPKSGAAHVGQLFFTDSWTNVIAQSAPYNENQNGRTMNSQDSAYAQSSSGGYSAIVDIEEIHDDWPEGIVGYITVGVNPHKSV